MNPEFLVALISGLLSTIAGGVASTELVRKLIYKIMKKELPQKT